MEEEGKQDEEEKDEQGEEEEKEEDVEEVDKEAKEEGDRESREKNTKNNNKDMKMTNKEKNSNTSGNNINDQTRPNIAFLELTSGVHVTVSKYRCSWNDRREPVFAVTPLFSHVNFIARLGRHFRY